MWQTVHVNDLNPYLTKSIVGFCFIPNMYISQIILYILLLSINLLGEVPKNKLFLHFEKATDLGCLKPLNDRGFFFFYIWKCFLNQKWKVCFCFLLGLLIKEKMKAPISLVILLHAAVVLCQKVVSKRGSGKTRRLWIDSFQWLVAQDKMCFAFAQKYDFGRKFRSEPPICYQQAIKFLFHFIFFIVACTTI